MDELQNQANQIGLSLDDQEQDLEAVSDQIDNVRGKLVNVRKKVANANR